MTHNNGQYHLLLEVLNAHFHERQLENGWSGEDVWSRINGLSGLAYYHDVLPILLDFILERDIIPDKFRENSRQNHRKLAARNIFLLNELASLRKELANAGVRSIALKGPVFAKSVYGSLSLRRARDLDILIEPRSSAVVSEVLDDMGYRRVPAESGSMIESMKQRAYTFFTGQFNFTKGARVYNLDIHTSLFPPLYAYRPSFDEIWKNRNELQIREHTIATLDNGRLPLFICYHGLKNRWERLKYISDLAYLVKSDTNVDWQREIEISRRSDSRSTLLLGLELVRRIYGYDIPGKSEAGPLASLKTIKIAASVERFLPESAEKGSHAFPDRARMNMHIQDSVRSRIRYVGMALFRKILVSEDGKTSGAET